MRAVLGAAVAGAGLWQAITRAAFVVATAAVGVLVGAPGAGVELSRALLPVIVALLLAAFCVRYVVRSLRDQPCFDRELVRGGKLLVAVAAAAWVWLAIELFYRVAWVGWATVFGDVETALWWLSGAVVGVAVIEQALAHRPRALRLGIAAVAVLLGVAAAASGWSHRMLVSAASLVALAIAGAVVLALGVWRLETRASRRGMADLLVASALLAAPLWRVVG